jgi:hypothetical protein
VVVAAVYKQNYLIAAVFVDVPMHCYLYTPCCTTTITAVDAMQQMLEVVVQREGSVVN